MALKPRDPLLAIVRAVITVSLWLCGLVSAILILAVPGLFLGRHSLLPRLEWRGGVRPSDTELIGALIATAAFLAVVVVVVFFFLRLLRQIIDTVGAGDPFVPENAVRLSRMAWLVLGSQLLSIPAGGISTWLALHLEHARIGIAISPSAILMALILFILARVFRTGAQMREELEGTV